MLQNVNYAISCGSTSVRRELTPSVSLAAPISYTNKHFVGAQHTRTCTMYTCGLHVWGKTGRNPRPNVISIMQVCRKKQCMVKEKQILCKKLSTFPIIAMSADFAHAHPLTHTYLTYTMQFESPSLPSNVLNVLCRCFATPTNINSGSWTTQKICFSNG